VESWQPCDRHIVPWQVLMIFANAIDVPAHLELCAAARWVLPRSEQVAVAAAAKDNGIVKLVSLHAREGGSFGGITNGFV
jgi:hypothetical protein